MQKRITSYIAMKLLSYKHDKIKLDWLDNFVYIDVLCMITIISTKKSDITQIRLR